MNENKSKFRWSYLIVLVLVVFLLVLVFSNRGYSGEEITGGPTEVQELVNGRYNAEKDNKWEEISAVYITSDTMYFLLEDSQYEGHFPDYADYYVNYTSTAGADFTQYYEIISADNSISIDVATQGINAWDIIYPVFYILFASVIIFMIYRFLNSSNKGAMSFGKSRAKAYTTSKVKFSDIAGTDEEKEELKEIVEFLKAPKKFTDLGARIPKGVLLVGYPGTGKTLLARAVAGEANVPFISISGSDFVEMFVGVGASRVRDLFDQAKKNKPCIVFIDEIDAVGRQRGAGLGGGNDEREQTLNQLLVEMDGFESNEGIIVLAATNRADILDPALMRPGRFDRQIYVNVPDVKGREGILRIHARNKPLDDNVDFKTLARITVGFTGADIENMLNEAAILAARAGRPKITMQDITEGINKVMMGPQKKSRLVTDRDRKITAYHESGHAILAKKLEHTDEVQEVSIIPRGMAGGYTMQRPENDNSYRTYNYLMDEICVCMGGRLAEELIFKDISTGASNDISQATKIAHNMVYNWGMSKNLGFLSLESSDQVFIGRDYQTRNDFSEKLAAEADDEVRAILDYNYKRAKKLLSENANLLDEMASLLLDKETINKEEVDMLIEGKTAKEVSAFMEEREKEQKEKEERYRREKAIAERRAVLARKLEEAKKLLESGVITQEDYNAVDKLYKDSMNDGMEQQEQNATAPENTVNVVVSQGKSLINEDNGENSENTTKSIDTNADDNNQDKQTDEMSNLETQEDVNDKKIEENKTEEKESDNKKSKKKGE